MASWSYEPKLHRYREVATGRIISQAAATSLRDGYLASRADELSALADDLFAGGQQLPEWELAMRGRVKTIWGAMYALGRGGKHAMTPADWRALGELVKGQFDYLHGFAEDLARGDLSPKQAANRAALYAHAATLAHERGKMAGFEGLELPAHPGDGSTPCLMRCRCAWTISETPAEWRCTWVAADDGGTCGVCEDRAREWDPYVVAKPSASAPPPPMHRAWLRPHRRPAWLEPAAGRR